MKISAKKRMSGLVLSTMLLIGAGGWQAASAITLRIADSLPGDSYIYRFVTKPFMEQVEQATNGEIDFKYFPGQQLGKAQDMLKLTQAGLVDIGYIGPSYIQGAMPLSAAFDLPGAFSEDSCQGFKALWATTHDGGFLQEHEFGPNDVIPVLTLITRHHIYVSNDRKIDSIGDLKGLKMRSSGGAMAHTIQDLGMVPIRVSAPETYEGMARGTVDGVIFPAQSAFDYGLTDLIKSGTVQRHYAGVVLTYAFSKNSWNKLTPDQQKTIMRIGKEISTTSCKKFDQAEDEAIARMEEQGIKPIRFDAESEKKIDAAFDQVADEWAAGLDKQGKPGSEALAAMRKAVEQAD